jgi:hypothetical protein
MAKGNSRLPPAQVNASGISGRRRWTLRLNRTLLSLNSHSHTVPADAGNHL